MTRLNPSQTGRYRRAARIVAASVATAGHGPSSYLWQHMRKRSTRHATTVHAHGHTSVANTESAVDTVSNPILDTSVEIYMQPCKQIMTGYRVDSNHINKQCC